MAKKISEVDQEIIKLIAERSNLYKNELRDRIGNEDISILNEEESIKKLIKDNNPGVLEDSSYERIFNEIISDSIYSISPQKVSFLGPEGTFTNLALNEIFSGSVEKIPQKTISDVFRSVEKGETKFGVIPIENSTEGAVTFTMDELVDTNIQIVAEKNIRISFSLISMEKDLSSVKKIYSHPQPVGQCKGWIGKNLPNAEIVLVDSTAAAAKLAKEDLNSAAIASHIASELYQLNLLETHIEDSRQNVTRFILVGDERSCSTGNDKTSIVCGIIKDSSGGLLSLLKPFAELGINMIRIESRPDKKKVWEYVFFIDFAGHVDDDSVSTALSRMKSETVFLKILGSYPIDGKSNEQ